MVPLNFMPFRAPDVLWLTFSFSTPRDHAALAECLVLWVRVETAGRGGEGRLRQADTSWSSPGWRTRGGGGEAEEG